MNKTIRNLILLLTLPALVVFYTSCTEKDDHSHDHDHDHEEHEHTEGKDEHEHHDEHAESEGDHDHDHEKKQAGPNGGRVITSVEPHLEFLVLDDQKIQIAAVDESGKAIPVAEQTVSVIGGDRSAPTRLNFTKQGEVLLSDIAFPEGDSLPTVLQITTSLDSVPVTERFNLNLHDCPTCEYKEYACICDHDEHHDHDHDHDEKDHDHKEKKE